MGQWEVTRWEGDKDVNVWCKIKQKSVRERTERDRRISADEYSENISKVFERVDQLELVLNRGGLSLKGVILSEKVPSMALPRNE